MVWYDDMVWHESASIYRLDSQYIQYGIVWYYGMRAQVYTGRVVNTESISCAMFHLTLECLFAFVILNTPVVAELALQVNSMIHCHSQYHQFQFHLFREGLYLPSIPSSEQNKIYFNSDGARYMN